MGQGRHSPRFREVSLQIDQKMMSDSQVAIDPSWLVSFSYQCQEGGLGKSFQYQDPQGRWN